MNRAQARAELARIALEVSMTDEGDPVLGFMQRARDAHPGPELVAALVLEGAHAMLRQVAA